MNIIKKITLILFFFLFPYLIFAQTNSSSTDFYFCTDEHINLIYFRNNENTRSLYLTSFSTDNKIHIANSRVNDSRTEGDNPIFIQSDSRSRTNLNHALRNHGNNINNFSKFLLSYSYNASNSIGFLPTKDKVKITLKRILDNSRLMSTILTFRDESKYIYISPRQILGRNYGCGRGIRIDIQRLNSPPIINRVNFDFDLPQRKLFINITVDEPLNFLNFKIISRNNQLLYEFTTSTNNNQTDFIFPVDLTILPSQQRLILKLTIKDLDNSQTSANFNFTTPRYSFNNPILRDVIVKELLSNRAIIWVLTSRITDLQREIGTESIVNYGIGNNLNQSNITNVNKFCIVNNIRYDCAQHTLTGLSSSTQYNFYVTLRNEAGLITTSSIRTFTTLGPSIPGIANLKANFISSQTTSSYITIDISGKIIDNNPPFSIRALLNNREISINLRNNIFSLRLHNIEVPTTSELVISIRNDLANERVLRFLLPALR